jgi:hypothetical protein
MTGIVKHAENAVKARQELAAVKAQASRVITDLIALVKGMYLFGDLEEMRFQGRLLRDVVIDLQAADNVADMIKAMEPTHE